MRSVAFETCFEGVVSVERGDGWYKPWRLPHESRTLFPSPENALMNAAGMPAAVRIRFRTDSRAVALKALPLGNHAGNSVNSRFDLTVDNEIVATREVEPGAETVVFEDLPKGDRVVELWLPPGAPVSIASLFVDDGAAFAPAPGTRKRWITYGSSLTHCTRANSAARVWPSIVARACNLHVTSLGFGGQCHIDPMIAMVIRDLPADYVTLKLGINVVGHGSLNRRTFAPNTIAMVRIIREKHPTTPIALVTSFCAPPFEKTPNAVGMNLEIVREETADAFERLVSSGDRHLVFCDGLRIVDAEGIAKYSADQCHHNGDGIEEIGKRWVAEVMTKLGAVR